MTLVFELHLSSPKKSFSSRVRNTISMAARRALQVCNELVDKFVMFGGWTEKVSFVPTGRTRLQMMGHRLTRFF